MNIASFAVYVIVFLAICAIVYAFVQYSGIPIPRPVMIVIYAVLAIAAILFLVDFAGIGGAPILRR